MTRRSFFIEHLNRDEEHVTLTGQTAHHVQSVLRMQVGDFLELRDGRGAGRQGTIVANERGAVRVRLTDRQLPCRESHLHITLAMAFARSDRMDLVVRQATELGVDRFVAYRSVRSQYGLSDAQAGKRRERWLKIAREAMCQCGRMQVPDIVIAADLGEYVSALAEQRGKATSLKLVACEGEEDKSLADVWRVSPESDEVLAVIGPEGGWSPDELQRLLADGFQAAHLGPRILRLETAAITFVALLQLLWGDFRSRDSMRV